MLDLLVRGARVVGPQAVGDWDIGVLDGKIALIAEQGATPPPQAAQVVDATGRLVVPGGIEPHAHLAHYISMRTESEMYTLGPEEDTVGMAFGGVTTHLDFCQVYPGTTAQHALEQRMARWKGQ